MIDFASTQKPFALIRRQYEDEVIVLSGPVAALDKLADIPRRSGKRTSACDRAGARETETFDTLSILPYRQIEELGYQARHEDEKILCMNIEAQERIPLPQLLPLLPQDALAMGQTETFVPDDAAYTAMVQRIIAEEIGNGAGCNFVVPRTCHGQIADFDRAKALSVFRRLLENEYGTYWTFLYFTGDRYFIGATPERHLSVKGGNVKMNPISGTFRKMEHDRADALPAMQAFLGDPKEAFELLMVVDEELKMMAEICSAGGQVVGPMIKEMSKLLHTEYVLCGQSDRDVIAMLRESMFAATVVGGPIENAARVNYRHNPNTRGYYGSALALLGRDGGGDTLDSPITIRMADVAMDGRFTISVGTSIVRDSVPESETAETTAKARGMLAAFGFRAGANDPVYRLGELVYAEDAMIKLSARNAKLSRFWIEDQSDARHPDPRLAGKRVTIIDNEDNFVRMLAHMIRPLGMTPQIVKNAEFNPVRHDADVIVLGPGPGDPRDASDPRIAKARALCRRFLAEKKPLLCICLGHQILCDALGLPLGKKQKPLQGAQVLIDYFGEPERVGFYNTFAGKLAGGAAQAASFGCEASLDPETGELHALRARHFAGMQFHPESILTSNGLRLLRDALLRLV